MRASGMGRSGRHSRPHGLQPLRQPRRLPSGSEEVEMDDRGEQIGRRELLALGLTGAAAAVVATVAEPGVAEATGLPASGELAGAKVDLAIEWKYTDSSSTLKVTGTVDGKPVDAKGNRFGGRQGSRPAHPPGRLPVQRRPADRNLQRASRSVGDHRRCGGLLRHLKAHDHFWRRHRGVLRGVFREFSSVLRLTCV